MKKPRTFLQYLIKTKAETQRASVKVIRAHRKLLDRPRTETFTYVGSLRRVAYCEGRLEILQEVLATYRRDRTRNRKPVRKAKKKT